MDIVRLADGLQEHTAGFAKAVAGAPADLRVPTCPVWPLRVLVGHIGQAHRWAAAVVAGGPTAVPDPHDADPGGPQEWSGWLLEGARDLADTVLTAGPDPVWTFFGPRPATFWLRRMRNDTAVHHADAALATGAAFDVAPDVAADAITELLELMSEPVTTTLKPSLAQLRGTGQTLALHPDSGSGWLITRTPDGVQWSRATAAADVTLAGPVADLLLVLTRRLPADQVTITGDRALADHWLARTAM